MQIFIVPKKNNNNERKCFDKLLLNKQLIFAENYSRTLRIAYLFK